VFKDLVPGALYIEQSDIGVGDVGQRRGLRLMMVLPDLALKVLVVIEPNIIRWSAYKLALRDATLRVYNLTMSKKCDFDYWESDVRGTENHFSVHAASIHRRLY